MALILYVEQLVFPTALLGFTLNTFQTGQVSLERVEELLKREPKIKDPEPSDVQPQPTAERRGRFEARGLTVQYQGAEKNTLNGLSFCIEPGELVAVVGAVGCGKTPWLGLTVGWFHWNRDSCSWMVWMSPRCP